MKLFERNNCTQRYTVIAVNVACNSLSSYQVLWLSKAPCRLRISLLNIVHVTTFLQNSDTAFIFLVFCSLVFCIDYLFIYSSLFTRELVANRNKHKTWKANARKIKYINTEHGAESIEKYSKLTHVSHNAICVTVGYSAIRMTFSLYLPNILLSCMRDCTLFKQQIYEDE